MTRIETMFLCAIFALYLSDCLYWITSGEAAFTRTSREGWQTHRRRPMSFTLLGRILVLSDPLLIHPGFLRTTSDAEPTAWLLSRVAHRLDRLQLLLMLARVQAFFLLVYLPALILLHRLAALWPWFCAVVLLTHVALSTLAVINLRQTRSATWRIAAASIILNPLGATRALDAISQAIFDRESSRAAKRRKP